jgi:ABC-2 type transport system ATP-binding protein
VLELAARFGGEVPELTVTRPSLESVYLRMIETVETEESDRTTGDRS